MLASTMIDTAPLRAFSREKLLQDFSALVKNDQQRTARMLAYIGEIDRRKLYLEHAYPSMFAFCTERFRMSESMAAKRIRTARAACSFPCISQMIERGELHLTGAYQLAPHLTEENHRELLRRAKHRSTREIELLVAEIAPKPDVKASVRALPIAGAVGTAGRRASDEDLPQCPHTSRALIGTHTRQTAEGSKPTFKPKGRTTPLSPRRYKVQVTIGQEARDKLVELQGLLSHQIPDGDPAAVIERALDALLLETKKKKAALTDKPRSRTNGGGGRTRAIPAQIKREVFERDEARCGFVDAGGRRCKSRWKLEFHHRVPYGKGGDHSANNIGLRCRGHNQYEAELEYGEWAVRSRQRKRRGQLTGCRTAK